MENKLLGMSKLLDKGLVSWLHL